MIRNSIAGYRKAQPLFLTTSRISRHEIFVHGFSMKDPFPLLSIDAYSYVEAKTHAAKADQWLGFEFEKIESQIAQQKDSNEVWRGLPVASLMTPYLELRTLLSLLELQRARHLIDLGCAYGRMAHVIGRHYPELQFTGYEIEAARVHEGQKRLAPFSYPNVQLLTQDLSHPDFRPVEADIYFIYDFGHRLAVEKTLHDLKHEATRQHIQVVARGRLTRHLIHQNHPWLFAVHPPKHYLNFSIYSS
jgi:hypothetical protein